MTQSTAILVFAVIMGAGLLVWLVALVRALRIGREPGGGADRRFDAPDTGGRIVERGEQTVNGDPEELSKALVRGLLQGHAGGSGFEVVERTARRVELRKTGPLVANQPAGLYFSEAEFTLEPRSGDEVTIRYQLGFDRLARMTRRWALVLVGAVALPLLVVVGGVMWFLVIPNETPAVRGQVFQTLHILHGLWPPFLFVYLYSVGRRHSKAFVSNLLSTLEHIT